MTSTPSLPAVALVASCELPTPWAVFRLHGFQETASGKEHLALTLGQVGDGVPEGRQDLWSPQSLNRKPCRRPFLASKKATTAARSSDRRMP